MYIKFQISQSQISKFGFHHTTLHRSLVKFISPQLVTLKCPSMSATSTSMHMSIRKKCPSSLIGSDLPAAPHPIHLRSPPFNVVSCYQLCAFITSQCFWFIILSLIWGEALTITHALYTNCASYDRNMCDHSKHCNGASAQNSNPTLRELITNKRGVQTALTLERPSRCSNQHVRRALDILKHISTYSSQRANAPCLFNGMSTKISA